MRRRRVVLFDDDAAVLSLLTQFFEDRDYEVLALGEPVHCPVYQDGSTCRQDRPCGDLMMTDLMMPRMSGIELLEAQARQGCSLDSRNKAVLSGSLDQAALETIRRLGCASFSKPFRLAALAAWVRECERRMDLSRPLGFKRREPRQRCRSTVIVAGPSEQAWVAEAVNCSSSGWCLRVDRPLSVKQVLDLRGVGTDLPGSVVVRWTAPHTAGSYLAGVSCC